MFTGTSSFFDDFTVFNWAFTCSIYWTSIDKKQLKKKSQNPKLPIHLKNVPMGPAVSGLDKIGAILSTMISHGKLSRAAKRKLILNSSCCPEDKSSLSTSNSPGNSSIRSSRVEMIKYLPAEMVPLVTSSSNKDAISTTPKEVLSSNMMS